MAAEPNAPETSTAPAAKPDLAVRLGMTLAWMGAVLLVGIGILGFLGSLPSVECFEASYTDCDGDGLCECDGTCGESGMCQRREHTSGITTIPTDEGETSDDGASLDDLDNLDNLDNLDDLDDLDGLDELDAPSTADDTNEGEESVGSEAENSDDEGDDGLDDLL